MSTPSLWAPGHLQELGEDECRDLLGSKAVGRVAFTSNEGPVVLPVNYVVIAGQVVFRTTPHSVIARLIQRQTAAFQVDEIDDYTQSGWSVLVRGPAQFLDSEKLPSNIQLETWPEGQHSRLVGLQLAIVTGRRLIPS